MADSIDIPIQILLIMQKYTRDARSVVKEASAMTAALRDVEQQAKRTGKALDNLKSAKVNIDVDSSSVNRAKADINALDSLSPKIDVDVVVDQEQAQSELKSLQAPKLEVDVTANEEQAQTELNSLTAPNLEVQVTADEEQAQSEINSLTAPDLRTTVTADLSKVEQQLADIKKLAKIQLVFDVAGAGLSIAQNVQNLPIVSGAQELDATLKQMQATTGQVIPDAEKLINDVFSAGNWGATREEVGGVIAELSKFPGLNDDLAASATTAFQVMQVTGTDFEGTLDAMRVLVANGLVPDVQSAGDLIVSTFQRGGDVAGDAIDSIREYSSQFAKAGIDGAQAMDLIIQGLQNGTRNGDALADMFKELNLRLTNAIDTGAGTEFDALSAAGLLDEAEAVKAGEMTGLQFAEAAQQALIDGFATEQNLFDAMGTQLEDFGIDIFKNLDFAQAAEAIIPPDVATEAANLLNDNLGAAFQNLGRVLETDVIQRLKAAGIDINEFLQNATNKLYEIAGLIANGTALPDALEIALEAPGLSDTIRGFESVFGNIVIELLTGFANLLSLIPGAGDTQTAVRGAVTGLAETQFAFDVQLADDGAGVTDAIETALRRGVDAALIDEELARAGQDMINRGDLEGAQQLLETVEALPAAYAKFTAVARGGGGVQDVIVPLSPEIIDDPAAIQAKVDEALAAIGTEGGYIRGGGGFEVELSPTVETSALEGLLFGAQSDLGEAATNWMDNLVEYAQANLKPPLSDADAKNLAASALATGDIATALDAAQRAGWPISEEDLQTLADGSDGYYDLYNKLTEYTTGLEDGSKDGTKAYQALVTEGIDPTVTAQQLLEDDTTMYFLGLGDQLENGKVAWQAYADFVNELEINPPTGITPPGTPGDGQNHASGGVMRPGWGSVGERGMKFISTDTALAVLNNMTTQALIRGVGMAMGGVTNNTSSMTINVNVMNNNANAAAGIASSDRLNARIRGFM